MASGEPTVQDCEYGCAVDRCNTCAEDAQCPGSSDEADEVFCVAGECVTCRSSTDCGESAPVCDSGACRACAAHDECGSQICDAGQCVPETQIAYAAPDGSTSSACTQSMPCSLDRVMAVVDASRSSIKLLPGTFPAPTSGEWVFNGSYQLTVVGPATVRGGFRADADTLSLRLRDLTSTAWVLCESGVSTKVPSLEIERVDVSTDSAHGTTAAVRASGCRLTMRDSSIQTVDPSATTLGVNPGGAINNGRLAIVERSIVRALEGVAAGNRKPISLGSSASLQMTNSVVRGGSNTYGAISFGTDASPSSIKFTTFYNTRLTCPDSPVLIESQNNIFLNELGNAPADLLTGTGCVHEYVLAKPQASPINGANNLTNLDPRFVDIANDDFHLLVGSPAIDAADPGATEAVDFDGTARPQGPKRDLGAFEYKP